MSRIYYLPADDKGAYLRHFKESEAIWVFGYGSLIWKPDFPVAEQFQAILKDFHRSFCLSSYHYRGTVEKPGLVLGLDDGGQCHGIALRIGSDHSEQALSQLWDREMISYAYLPVLVEVEPQTELSKPIRALTFVIKKDHEQYAGALSDDRVLARVMEAQGSGGSNIDYLFNTAKHLYELGIADEYISRLAAKAAMRLGLGKS